MFNKYLPQAALDTVRVWLIPFPDSIATHVKARDYLVGSTFSVADAYFFTALNWLKLFSFDLEHWRAVASYSHRVGARPSVTAAMLREAETPPVD